MTLGNSGPVQRQPRQHVRARRSSIQMKSVLQRDMSDTVQAVRGEQPGRNSGPEWLRTVLQWFGTELTEEEYRD